VRFHTLDDGREILLFILRPATGGFLACHCLFVRVA